MTTDIETRTEGTVVLLTPATQTGIDWMAEHLRVEFWPRLDQGAVAVDAVLARDVILGAQLDQLVIE